MFTSTIVGGGANVKPIVSDVLARLHGIKKTRKGWTARCPAHDDRQASLAVAVGDDGRILVKCFVGCAFEEIMAKIGLKEADAFPNAHARNQHGRRLGRPRRTRGEGAPPAPAGRTATTQPGTPAGCTLEAYARAKKLPVEFLRTIGLSDVTSCGGPAVRIPYVDGIGAEVAVRWRVALEKSDDGDNRFRWRVGSKPCLYGRSRLESARAEGDISLVEGESDCHTLWFHKQPAVGLPGAASWREEWADELEGIQCLFVVVEPDRGGAALMAWLAKSRLRDRVRLITDREGFKDPSALYLDDPDRFGARWAAAKAKARPWSERAAMDAEAARARAWADCEALARAPRILEVFADDLRHGGLVGETGPAKLLYLSVTSRLFDRPVSVAVKGPSSGGKSHLVERVLAFFPPEAYYALSSMSERALAYSEEPLQQRMLVLYEAAGLNSDFASYLLRSLLSEGRVRYETVERTTHGLRARLIERAGPTGLIITTTAVKLHPENETRLLSIPVADTDEQTRKILLALASGPVTRSADTSRWHALQEWLARGETRVLIPFATALAEAIPPVAIRLRRDFSAVLALIRAHALLHQATRGRDDVGQVVATIEDYEAVRELVAGLVADTAEAAVSPTLRETVEAVARLLTPDEVDDVTVSKVAEALKLDKSAALRRVKAALDRGYLRNLEDRRGRPARLVIGEPLPIDRPLLPRRKELEDALRGCTVAGESGAKDTALSVTTIGSDWRPRPLSALEPDAVDLRDMVDRGLEGADETAMDEDLEILDL